jgi:hypothetical protein
VDAGKNLGNLVLEKVEDEVSKIIENLRRVSVVHEG